MQRQKSVLIIASSENLRESLFVLLRSIPQIDTIQRAEDAPSALAMEPEIQPALVFLDYELPGDELRTILAQIHAAWSQARCVVFLGDQEDRCRVQGAGADVVLVKGIRAATVLETIEGMLSEEDHS
jgi:DNA-binding NarL/FixJ family response regulator